ncbi:LysR substrate-binding domain-containing protein [Clostridium hydrogenum]|uniref:LysR substrate-binding domain-containing protein n=1 Tax=Clostridium hydrogenum TaxID=2855764 RepID=UPI0038B27A41
MKINTYLKHSQDIKKIRYVNPLEFSSTEAIKKCVMNGLGISFVPYYAVRDEAEKGSLKVIEVEEKYSRFRIQLSYHKNKNISVAMRKLMEIVEVEIGRGEEK